MALLLSPHTFEQFYERVLGLTRTEFIASYRNDWSWEYAAALSERGFSVALYLPSLRYRDAEQTHDGYLVRFLPVHAAYRPWDRIPALRRSPFGRYVAEAVNTLGFLRPLRHALVEDRIDVLLVQEYWTARFDVLALDRPVPIIAVEQSRPGRHQVAVLKRWTFPRAAALQVQTASEERRLARYGVRIHRITNFIDSSFWTTRSMPREDEKLLLAVGRLSEAQKRLSDAIRALALLPAPWRLEILGRGPDRAKLERLAEELGVSGRVRFRDFVGSREELRTVYCNCSVFVLPSAHEGLPVALLEAMSCGAAVVATEIDGVREIVTHGENGLLVPVGQPGTLAEAIQVANEQRAVLGAAARRTIQAEYSRSVVGDRLAALLKEATGRTAPTTS